MSTINYGLANKEPQPVIAPTADKLARMKSGAPVPCRPEWLCITSPEHAVGSRLTGHDAKDLSSEEAEAFEAAEREKVRAREAKAEARKLQADAARVEKKIQAAKDKKAREELAKKNKSKGFKNSQTYLIKRVGYDPIYRNKWLDQLDIAAPGRLLRPKAYSTEIVKNIEHDYAMSESE